MTDEQLGALEDVACPGPGACGGQFTANTMSTVCELLGVSPMSANGVPAMETEKGEVSRRAGALVMDLVRKDLRPRRIVTRAALDNAIAAVASTGGSTNAVLHLLAIAHEAGVDLKIEDFDRVSERTPLLADLKPGGRFVATDLYRAGGIGLVARRLQEAGLLNRDCLTVTGQTIGQVADAARNRRGEGFGAAGNPSIHRQGAVSGGNWRRTVRVRSRATSLRAPRAGGSRTRDGRSNGRQGRASSAAGASGIRS